MTISKNQRDYGVTDLLIKASTEIGIPENESYNNGNNQGNLLSL